MISPDEVSKIMTQLGKRETMNVSRVSTLCNGNDLRRVKFVTLKWLVLRLSLQPPRGVSFYIHYLSLQEAASVEMINPERKVLNMYKAFADYPKQWNSTSEEEGSLQRLFCLRQES